MKEKITIQESLTIYIKDANGKVTKRIIKPLWSDLKWWEKILIYLRIKKYPGTLQSFGLENAARLYGNVGSPLYINRIGAYRSGAYSWKIPTLTYEATGILVVDNKGDPFPTGYNYEKVGCRNAGDVNVFNEIVATVDLSGSPTITWWAEIKFVFT